MRCSKCGSWIIRSTKFCTKCGATLAAAEKAAPGQKKKRGWCCLTGLIILAILLVWSLISFIYGGKFQLETARALTTIQSNLVEITSVKLMGNYLVTGKEISGVSLANVKSTAETKSQTLANLSAPSALKDYQAVAIIWANKIAAAADSTKAWKNLANQPGASPLTLSDSEAGNFFQSSIKTIAGLKTFGAEAVKNKNREAMRQIAAKLLVQEHWLNTILYSQNSETAAFNLIPAVLAFNQDPSQVPDIGQVDDVTCQVCSDPKIKWTTQLRAQYGCDTRCKPQQTVNNTQTQQTQGRENQNQPEQESNDQKEDNINNEVSLADIERLESYTYKGVPKRAVCIGTGGLSVGDHPTNVFCVEDAVTTITEITFSAIGFADASRLVSVDQWNKQYKKIDDTAGWHLLEGLGVIGISEPDKVPEPKKSPSDSNQPKLTTPPPVVPPPTPPDNSEEYSYPPIPEIVIDFSNINPNSGSGPAPVIDLERDYSAEQTGGSGRW